LEEVMGEDIEWLENLDDVTFSNKMEVEVIIERPQRPVNPHPLSADTDTIGTFFPGQIIYNRDEESVANSDVMTMDPSELANDESREARPTSEAPGAEDSLGSLAGGL
jgi:hypothetical protein